jgi:hypothetical protein
MSAIAGHTSRQTAVLHVGMSKAGSSTIRQSLVANASVLANAGLSHLGTGRRWGNACYKIFHDLRNE